MTTSCPLDCPDSCEVVFNGKDFLADTNKITNSKLCPLFRYLLKDLENNPLNTKGSIDELIDRLKTTNPKKVLYYKGSGNFGVMQNVTKLFFSKYGATFAGGSLCDGSGEAGIRKDRVNVINPPIENLYDSEVVIVWGKNISVTSSHFYDIIKDKIIITIDPIKTKVAKNSALHIQIKPKTDYLLALILTKVLQKNPLPLEFRKILANIEINDVLKKIDINKIDFDKLVELLKDKKIAIMLGVGVQKYYEGSDIIRFIEAFGNSIGIFNKPYGGIWYLSDSNFGYENPFSVKWDNIVNKVEIDFSDYDLVFIQGANPAVTLPNLNKVRKGLEETFVVFFGTTENETSKFANIKIKAKSFLAKKDIRLSYSHDRVVLNEIIKEEDGISEYELTKILMDSFNYKLQEENQLLSNYIAKNIFKPKVEFSYIDKLDIKDINLEEDEFYLVTAKAKNSLNSQFRVDDNLYLSKNNPFSKYSVVIAKTKYAEVKFNVKVSKDLRDDMVLAYVSEKINYLTPDIVSKDGNNACFEEIKIKLINPYKVF